MQPRVVRFSADEIRFLRKEFLKLGEVTPFQNDLEFSSKIASYGIFREIGTLNDELARFIFDATTERPVRLESLKAELIEHKGLFGLRIFSLDSQRLELRTKGFYEVVHPQLSCNEDGSLHSLYIFPEIINKIAQSEGAELVLVKSWGLNSIFGGFDPAKSYYQTNFWEIENNDALKFADLIRKGQIAFMGTHDLIAHIAGLEKKHWPLLKTNAQRVYEAIGSYFKSVLKPSIASLILPYTIGVVLDDLAQPPSYSSKGHIAVLDELLDKISKNQIPANLPTILTQFPSSFENIINLSRTSNIEDKAMDIQMSVNLLVREIFESTYVVN